MKAWASWALCLKALRRDSAAAEEEAGALLSEVALLRSIAERSKRADPL